MSDEVLLDRRLQGGISATPPPFGEYNYPSILESVDGN